MKNIEKQIDLIPKPRIIGLCTILGLTLVLIAYHNYLFFNFLTDGFCIVLAALVHILAVKTYRYSKEWFLLFLSYSYLFSGCLYSAHLLTQPGMGIFSTISPTIASEFFIANSFLQAISLLVAPFFIEHRISRKFLFWFYFIITGLLLAFLTVARPIALIFFLNTNSRGIVFIRGFVIAALFYIAAINFYRHKNKFKRPIYLTVQVANGFTILAQFIFSFSNNGNPIFNIISHLSNMIAYYIVFYGVILQGIEAPYDHLFKNLKKYSILDPLTGLYNRNGLLEFTRKELARMRREGYSVGILVIDLDGFKGVNDTYGHLVGDQALKKFASILSLSIRETDLACRLGGDEFVILLKAGKEDIKLVRLRILEAFQRWQLSEEYAQKIGVSIGSALWGSDAQVDFAQVLREADHEMYRDKKKKKYRDKIRESTQLSMFG